MATHIALLRAVNVGGRKLAMAELKEAFESLGFTDARTILHSGNVIFGSAKRTGAALESYLEAATEKRFKLSTDYLVRTVGEWDAIVAQNPFPREGADDPSHLLVLALKSAPLKSAFAALQAAIPGREIVRAAGRELYAYYPDGIGESKLTVALIERKLQTRCTGRNWNTALKIQAATAAQE
ncbi:MAG TPA: DUF1697 domain-containing protein [Terriglobia bacterium]|nr:DUF1697 domain-containing protein [Terriglobia bacterium]